MTKYMNMISSGGGGGGGKRKKSIVKLKLVVEMLQKTVLMPGSSKKSSPQRDNSFFFDDVEMSGGEGAAVPADVKEGHFAVIAATKEGDQVKRFVVPLSYLEYPPFMRLLKEAEEEYGFDNHHGALTLPCHPTELDRILLSHQQENRRRRRSASGSFMLINRMITNWVALST